MSKNPLAAKVAAPYARALYDFSVEQNLMHQITADFQNLEVFLEETPDLTNYLNNPLIGPDQKQELLDKQVSIDLLSWPQIKTSFIRVVLLCLHYNFAHLHHIYQVCLLLIGYFDQ